MTIDTQRFGFIGLGAMGYHMAANLWKALSSNSSLAVYDVSPEVLQRFCTELDGPENVQVAKSAADVVTSSDVIITMVPEGKHVRAVMLDVPYGALSVDIAGKLFLECSTIDIETSQIVADRVGKAGAYFVDAPVSGGPAGAKKGTLTFMLGLVEGHPRFNEIREILLTMGKNLFACGGPTLGLATKICNNYISGTIAIATAEGMNLAMNLGLNPKTFSDVLSVSTGGSWVNSNCNPVPGVDPSSPASNGYAPGFKVQFMRKDYNLAIEAASSSHSTLYLGPSGLKVYTDASNDPNCVDRDSRVVYRFIGGKETW